MDILAASDSIVFQPPDMLIYARCSVSDVCLYRGWYIECECICKCQRQATAITCLALARLAFQFAAVVAPIHTSSCQGGAQAPKQARSCPHMRLPSGAPANYYPPAFPVAFDRITRPSASSKDPLPHPSCNTKQSRISRKHKPTVSPNQSVYREQPRIPSTPQR